MALATLSPARRTAHAVVVRTLVDGAYADRALHGEARGLEPRDRALAKQLAFGTVQRRLTLDHVIATHVDRALEPRVRAALQLGLFQLLFLDGVAEHAAIAEAVELAKPSPGHRLVNAVLRRVQREGVELPSDAEPAGAAIRHSHPRWMVELWWDWLGPDATRALLAADNEPAELALRVNTLVDYDLSDIPGGQPDDAAAARSGEPGWRAGGLAAGEAIVVEGPFDALAHPGYAAGAFTPQSRASQLVARTVAPLPGERVLDLCAAPGGKTTHLAALMEGEGEVVAVERHPQRARALQATSARLRAANVTVVTADARDYDGAGAFDRVLLDPPCSGLGTLRSHPDLRWRASLETIEALAAEQDALLRSARRALAPGGTLVYSVCTLSPGEERLVTADVQRTFPHVDGTDGFYIARDGR
jgi:16S rRNA (cytosine967-C5)-methyltransferase